MYNENKYSSVPIAHSTKLKEPQDTIAFISVEISSMGDLCGLKNVIFSPWREKCPCWSIRHTVLEKSVIITVTKVGEKHVINQPLFGGENIFPLRINLGLMNHFITALVNNGSCFEYIDGKGLK